MNKLFFVIISFFLTASSSDVPYSQIESAFNSQNAAKIVSLCKDKVIIDLNGQNGMYSSAQATQVLKGFFDEHRQGSFSFSFKGQPADNSCFAIGTYKDGNSKFRVSIHFKKLNGKFLVERLSIEKN